MQSDCVEEARGKKRVKEVHAFLTIGYAYMTAYQSFSLGLIGCANMVGMFERERRGKVCD